MLCPCDSVKKYTKMDNKSAAGSRKIWIDISLTNSRLKFKALQNKISELKVDRDRQMRCTWRPGPGKVQQVQVSLGIMGSKIFSGKKFFIIGSVLNCSIFVEPAVCINITFSNYRSEWKDTLFHLQAWRMVSVDVYYKLLRYPLLPWFKANLPKRNYMGKSRSWRSSPMLTLLISGQQTSATLPSFTGAC